MASGENTQSLKFVGKWQNAAGFRQAANISQIANIDQYCQELSRNPSILTQSLHFAIKKQAKIPAFLTTNTGCHADRFLDIVPAAHI